MTITTSIKNKNHYLSILNSVIGQLSDGIWENSRAAEKYWKSLSVGTDENGYITITDRHNVCSDPVSYFANKIKHILKIENDDGNSEIKWERHCSAYPHYLGYCSPVTVGECYKLYDLLKGRDTSNKHYAIYENYEVTISIPNMLEPKTVKVEALSARDAQRIAKNNLMEELMKLVEVSVS